jgi:hypothetical protein
MFFQKSDSKNQEVTLEDRLDIQNLMRSYVLYECMQSRTYTDHKDLEKEVDSRLSVLLS